MKKGNKPIIATCIVRQKLNDCKNKTEFKLLKAKLLKEYCISSTNGSCFSCPYLELKKINKIEKLIKEK